MPDDNGCLTPTESQKARSWLEDRVPNVLRCRVCSKDTVKLADSPRLMSEISGTGPDFAVKPASGTAVVMLSCTNCASIQTFDAMQMGVL